MRALLRRSLLYSHRSRPLRITTPRLPAITTQQQRFSLSNNTKPNSSTLDRKTQDSMASPASLNTAEVLQGLKEELATMPERNELWCLEESLANSSLQPNNPWGFVVIRAVYGPESDDPWSKMVELLRDNVAESIALYKQNHLQQCHALTIIEDEATLSGADSYAVRRAFRTWVAEDLPQRLTDATIEQYGGLAQVRSKLFSSDAHHAANATDHPAAIVPPRWQFCLYVDDDCIRSLNACTNSQYPDPALKLLTTDWAQEEPSQPSEPFEFADWDGGETDNEHENVGWRYIEMSDYVTQYNALTDPSWFNEHYERPYKSWVDENYND